MLVFNSRNDILVRTRDGRNFSVQEHFEFEDEKGSHYRLAIGTESDGGTTPELVWSLGFTPFGPWWIGTVIHDAAYRGTLERQMVDGTWVRVLLPRDQCDLLLLDAMTALGVDILHKEAIYEAVRLGGQEAFDKDRQGV